MNNDHEHDDPFDLTSSLRRRAAGAPTTRPDFATVLADRHSRTRRRTTVATVGIVAIGISGVAAFGTNGGSERSASVADGSDVSGVPAPSGASGIDTLWYCEGAVDPQLALATTTVFPTTTIESPDGTVAATTPASRPSTGESGYFRHCEPVSTNPAVTVDAPVPTTTIMAPKIPTTTVLIGTTTDPEFAPVPATAPPITNEMGDIVQAGSYIVQSGDYPVLVAEKFGVRLDDLLSFNGWDTSDEFPFPGEVVLIPPANEAATFTTTTSLLSPPITTP